ncbi:MAG TPA: GumC family protein [Devosiaceae bacterium]|jgi:uncharacterized protein involved in exopolysaccharide biosynthesis
MTDETSAEQDLSMDVRAMLAAVWGRKFRILLVTAILLGLAYAILLFVPKMYESEAGILVEPRDSVYTRPSGDTGSNQANLTGDGAISSQIELIQSRDTLLKVIDSEHLRDVPEFTQGSSSPLTAIMALLGRKPAQRDVDEVILQNLMERLTVVRQRDSLVISVNVRSTDPQLAARLANAIANAHVQRRAALSLSDTADASVWLDQQVKALRTKVADAESKVAAFKVDNDLYTGSNNTSLVDQQLSEVAGQITSAQERKNSATSRANLIRSLLDAGQPIDSVADVRDSATIQQLTQQRGQLQGEKAQKLATLLPNHPEVQALTAQIAEIDKQINSEGRRVAGALEAEAKIEASLETSLRADLDKLKTGSADATKQGVTLDGLEREAKAQRDLLESYLARYRDAMSRTDANSALPDVRVITEAAASVSPASPKVTLIMTAVGIIALVLQIGSILFGELMSGRALSDRDTLIARREARQRPRRQVVAEAMAADPETVTAVVQPSAPPRREVRTVAEPAAVAMPQPSDEDRFENFEQKVLVERQPAVESQPPRHSEPAFRRLATAELGNLASDIGLGRVRIVMVAGLGSYAAAANVGERLVAEALRRGLSIARIDAGSARLSTEAGLTDLAADAVGFGDVVHRSSHEGMAEIPWGQLPAISRQSLKPVTLVEALTDIYEVVLVLTGAMGASSALPIFAGVDCRVVLVADEDTDDAMVATARSEVEALNFAQPQVVTTPIRQAEVA